MKKNIFYMIACGALILAAAACSKEQANNEPQEEPAGLITESLSAQKESEATKVLLDRTTLAYSWSPNKEKVAFSIWDGEKYVFVNSGYYGETVPDRFTVTYEGTRQGYAVTPNTYAKSLSTDGNTLTVTYPEVYSIKSSIAAGINDTVYDDEAIALGLNRVNLPMIAMSDPSSSTLMFRSIGALVRVVVNNVPVGTKSLYITFNKIVTGDFIVSNPDSDTPFISAGSGSSTVIVNISDSGLTTERNISLYIPVPTTTGLTITSNTGEPKANVLRNYGYQFTVDAITRVDATTDFQITGSKNYQMASGDLRAYNNSGSFVWSFSDPVETTMGAGIDDPHVSTPGSPAPSRATNGQYQDLFDWDDLYKIFTGEATAPSGAGTIATDNEKTIGGKNWHVPTKTEMEAFVSSTDRLKKNSIFVGNRQALLAASIHVDVSGSAKENYALANYYYVYGCLLIPDGYVDQTDLIRSHSSSYSFSNQPTIKYSAFNRMIENGAIFLLNAGWYNVDEELIRGFNNDVNLSYWTNEKIDATDAYKTDGSSSKMYQIVSGVARNYRGVRLVRDATSD